MKQRVRRCLPPALLLTLALVAPAASQQAFAPADRLPFDSAVTTGTLPNGLRYYIRRNTRPEKRVMLQLAVKAGSVDENDDQQGLAHVLEHMAFNGTTHFKAGELIAQLESTGVRLGPHVNAYTAFDETVYQFELPTDKPGVLLKGLQALADFAGGMTLDPKEIDKERGVVIEEWRGGLGASSRIRDQQFPILFYNSKYAERLPIGKPEILKSFPPERLREFYTKWYRPDRMGLVVVGEIQPAEILSMVQTGFGPLAKPSTAPPNRTFDVPLHAEVLMKVSTDPEATQSSVSITRKRKSQPEETVADYRRNIVQQLVFQMINDRFDEMSRKKDAEFLGAGAYESDLSPTVDTVTLSAGVEDGKIAVGLSVLEMESNRVKQFGFGASELDRAKKWTLAGYERAFNERDKTDSGSYVQEYINHFLTGEPSPGIEYEYNLAKQAIPTIAINEINETARSLFSDQARVVLAVSPKKDGLAVPTEADLRATMTRTDAVAVMPWNDTSTATVLMAKNPEAGTIADRKEIAPLGVTVVRFANGVEAWLKPTDFKNDSVVFSLSAPGGVSLAPPDRYLDASLAPTLVDVSGVGGHSAVDLQKLLAGKIASASPSAGLSSQSISGSASPAHLETGLQLLYLSFTEPGDDPDAFALIRKQLEATYGNRDRNPGLLFNEKVNEINSSGHYTSKPVTVDRIRRLDEAAMIAFYRERFRNAADFTFYMVGAFKIDDALPLVARYVGSLPSQVKPAAAAKDVGMKFPDKIERAKVEKGREPKAQTVLSFAAEPPIEENEQTRVEAATDVLETALRDILREELGETYTVSVGLYQSPPQQGTGQIRVTFGAAPENIEKMLDRVLQEVKKLQQDGPSADLTNRAKETALREHETAVRQNGWWLGRLQSAKLLGRDPLLILKREERIRAVTPELLRDTFRKYFPLDRYTVVTLVPEK